METNGKETGLGARRGWKIKSFVFAKKISLEFLGVVLFVRA